MKNYNLALDDSVHTKIKRAAAEIGESMKDFLVKGAEERIETVEFFKSNKELQEDIKNRDKMQFVEVDSILDVFK